MPTTTTIRLPDSLKDRAAAAAERAGTTTHNFILQAIAEKTERAERAESLDLAAEQRYAEIVETGLTIPWREMRAYMEASAAGKPARRPKAKKLAR